MKATGIVRRIDDLGRVVVPKEIRRTLRIREGDPLEIYTDREGEIILKKYSPIGELGRFAEQCADTVFQSTGNVVIITDRDQLIAVAGMPKKEILNRSVTKELEKIINGRKNYKRNICFCATGRKCRYRRITSDKPSHNMRGRYYRFGDNSYKRREKRTDRGRYKNCIGGSGISRTTDGKLTK